MSFVVVFTIFLFISVHSQGGLEPINIVFIWFDDLGFSDLSYNGGDYPTPILDELANNDAIKLNWHYSEQICSASRSALLTGRYAWLSGVNDVVYYWTDKEFNRGQVLFPQILNDNGWRTFIAGKWHVGYANSRTLPRNNGFRTGLYSRQGLQYYVRGNARAFRQIDREFGAPDSSVQAERDRVLGRNFRVSAHDTYRLDDYIHTAAFVGDNSYSEDLYTQEIKQYVIRNRGAFPFFIYYSQWTPHTTITQPPEIRPNGDSMDYTVCYDAFPDASGGYGNCDARVDTRCVFCKQMHYAAQNIKEIIDEIKANSRINWDQTLIVITSDNGAQPTTNNGTLISGGSAVPYRGVKASSFEGGIRTPAILKGGYVENILSQNSDLENNMCEYDGMVHISDWYHIFMDITGIRDTNYDPDSDHRDLSIWEHIRCKCRGRRPSNSCDNLHQQRDEIITMKMCGNPQGDYFNGDKFFFSTYLRKGDYKLVINGSNLVTQTCDNFTDIDRVIADSSWHEADGVFYKTPNQEYYDNAYRPRFEHDNEMAMNLYQSDCLDSLDGTAVINDANYEPFMYQTEMVFDIENDPIEACNVLNDTKKMELFQYLLDRSNEYATSTTDYEANINAFATQMSTYDCTTTYTRPWNGRGGGDINTIWLNFIERYQECQRLSAGQPLMEPIIPEKGWTLKNYIYETISILTPIIVVVSTMVLYLKFCGRVNGKA